VIGVPFSGSSLPSPSGPFIRQGNQNDAWCAAFQELSRNPGVSQVYEKNAAAKRLDQYSLVCSKTGTTINWQIGISMAQVDVEGQRLASCRMLIEEETTVASNLTGRSEHAILYFT
jgi:hypothetical protein